MPSPPKRGRCRSNDEVPDRSGLQDADDKAKPAAATADAAAPAEPAAAAAGGKPKKEKKEKAPAAAETTEDLFGKALLQV